MRKRPTSSLLILLGMSICFGSAAQRTGSGRLENGLEGRQDILYFSDFESDQWVVPWGTALHTENVRLVDPHQLNEVSPFQGKALEITVRKGAHFGVNLNFIFKDHLGYQPDEMYSRYYCYLGEDWVGYRGKAPGWGGTEAAGWGGRPSNGRNGWSARGGIGKSSETTCWMSYYTYHAQMKGKFGDSFRWSGKGSRLETKRWYCVEQYCKINTPGKDNGILRAWIDGDLVFEKTDTRMRDTAALSLKAFWLNIYYGGKSTSDKDRHIYIDNLVLATDRRVGSLDDVKLEIGSEVDLPSADEVETVMRRVNAYQLAHPYRHRRTQKPVEHDRNWIRATYYTGVSAMYQTTGARDIYQQLIAWAKKHDWQAGDETYSLANRLTCGQIYLELYFLNSEQHMIQPLQEWVDSGLPGSPSSPEIWYLEDGRMWCDSLYTAPPTLVMLTKATGIRRYLDYMNRMYWDVHSNLFDQDAGLFYRDERFIDQRTPAGKKVLWSRGNGWVIAGLARILTHLPKGEEQYSRFLDLYMTMAAAISLAQGEDGLWRSNLADTAEYPNPESSGSAFFCYALAWGINNGILPVQAYLPIVTKAWRGLVSVVHAPGKLGWVQQVGAAPESTAYDSTHEYGTGAFLLAGSEMIKLANSRVN